MRGIRSFACSLVLILVAAAPTSTSAEGTVQPRFVTCPGTGWDVLGNQHLAACDAISACQLYTPEWNRLFIASTGGLMCWDGRASAEEGDLAALTSGTPGPPTCPANSTLGFWYPAFGPSRAYCTCNAGTVANGDSCESPQAAEKLPSTETRPDEPGTCSRHPIVLATGVKVLAEEDLRDESPHPLTLMRHYASAWGVPPAAGLGTTWSHGHSHRVLLEPAARTVSTADGRITRFMPIMQGGVPAGWQADASLDTLFDTPEGIVYQRADDDSRWLFDSGTGQVLWMGERNGWTYRYSYSGGLLAKVTNAFGRELTFSHDAAGRLVMVTGPDGASVSYAHDAASRLVQMQRPDGSWNRYVYEDERFPHAVTGAFDETGSRRQNIAYDEQGRAVLSELYGGAGRTRVAYDTLRTTVTDSLGVSRSYQYQAMDGMTRGLRTIAASAPAQDGNTVAAQGFDAHGLLASQTDFLGTTTLYGWDLQRRLPVSVTRAAGLPEAQATAIEWHPALRLPVKVTDPTSVKTITYDERGNKLTETVADPGSGAARTWSWIYDEQNLPRAMTDPRGGTWRFVHDANGNLAQVVDPLARVTRFERDAAGRVTVRIDPDGRRTVYAYDVRGRLLARHRDGETTGFGYTPYTPPGEMGSVSFPSGYRIDFEHDPAERLVGIRDNRGERVSFMRDAAGNEVRTEVRGADGTLALLRTQGINGLNKVAAVRGASGLALQLTYDANGRLQGETDALNHTSRHALDPHGRRIVTRFPDGAVMTQAWNVQGTLAQVIDPGGVPTRYEANGFGELLTETSPDIGTLRYQRDASGAVAEFVDARGQRTQLERDALGRVTRAIHADGSAAAYHYDDAGHLAQISDVSGTVDYQRDAQGRIVAKTQTVLDAPGSPTVLDLRYSYQGGQLRTLRYPSGLEVTYEREAGRIKRLRVRLPGGSRARPKPDQPFVSDIRYAGLGRPAGWTWSNGDEAWRRFDADGHMTSSELADYGYDAAGRMVVITQWLWVSSGSSEQPFEPVPFTWYASYDSRGRIVGFDRPGASTEYTYDANGNRLTAQERTTVDTDFDGSYGPADFARTQLRNSQLASGSNRLLGMTLITTTYRKGESKPGRTAGHNEYYTVDASGSLTSDGERSFEYGADGRLRRVTLGKDGEAASIRYLTNALGQRVFKGEPEVAQSLPDEDTLGPDFIAWLKQRFRWLFASAQATTSVGTAYVYGDGELPPWALLGEYDNGSAAGKGRTEYLWLPTEDGSAIVVGYFRGGQLYAVHTDHLGTPRLVTDKDRAPVWQWPYSAFGQNKPTGPLKVTEKPKAALINEPELLAATKPVEFNLRFPGQYFDVETGTHQNYMRDYDPLNGRYRQGDPIGLRGGINRYQYAGVNPLSYTDPNGLNPVAGAMTGAAAGSALGPVGSVAGGLVGAGVGAWIGWSVLGPIFRDKTPAAGEPGSWHNNPGDGKPGNGQERLYGPNGQPEVDIDWHPDHGAGKPHGHNWENGRRGPGVPLSPWPRGRIINGCPAS